MLKICIAICAIIVFNGCVTRYVDREMPVNIPVPCSVPQSDCPYLNGLEFYDGIIEYERCIAELKENAKVCP